MLTENKYFQAPYNGYYKIDGIYYNPDNRIQLAIDQPLCALPNGSGILDWKGKIQAGETVRLRLTTSDPLADWSAVLLRARIRYWSNSLPDTLTVWTPGDRQVVHPAGCVWGDTVYRRLFGPLYNG